MGCHGAVLAVFPQQLNDRQPDRVNTMQRTAIDCITQDLPGGCTSLSTCMKNGLQPGTKIPDWRPLSLSCAEGDLNPHALTGTSTSS